MTDETIANLTRLLVQTVAPPVHPHRRPHQQHHNASAWLGPASSGESPAAYVPPPTSPRMDRGGIPMWFGMSRHTAKSLSGVFVLLFVLLTIIVVLLFSFFLVRRCNREKKRQLKGGRNPFVPEPYSLPNNEVAHTKRVYEIQAEEGCIVEMPDPENLDEEQSSSRRSSVVGEKIMQVVRKITVAQPPPSDRPKTRVAQLMAGCS